eukprot:CAMPEP_0171546844 /NCGR_PEP_ID=MMETSP0960-20121227/4858_1 /TAXON_ID=87120 /ORGANISM="Aurantiochytrium limacinum, Strain ATCCMYA-1381" /LENGTH=84 /DNA_ID=CAMNT_0012094961 /DNA_START=1156 /DNA_END=1407 /DNA_ORIENTATION=+
MASLADAAASSHGSSSAMAGREILQSSLAKCRRRVLRRHAACLASAILRCVAAAVTAAANSYGFKLPQLKLLDLGFGFALFRFL